MTAAAMHPLLFRPVYRRYLWGGRRFATRLARELPPGDDFAESWEVVDRPADQSVVAAGPLAGRPLGELVRGAGEELLGRHAGLAAFPLLFKFLDAQTELSVQVHPDDSAAKAHGDGGKTEAWLVLQTLDDARIVRGFQPGVSRAQFEAVAHTADVEKLLYKFRPHVGDCIYVPAGTVHAIGPGAVVFEVQQNSDITWRLYDWGRNRTVHLEHGIPASRITDGSLDPTVKPKPLSDGGTLLLANPFFRMRRYALRQKFEAETNGAFVVVTVIAGQGTLGWHSGGSDLPIRLQPGDCVLVPATTPSVYLSPIGGLDVVLTDPARS